MGPSQAAWQLTRLVWNSTRRNVSKTRDCLAHCRLKLANSSHGYASFSKSPPGAGRSRPSPFANLSTRSKVVIGLSALGLAAFDTYHYMYIHELPPIFDPERYVKFGLIAKERISDDTFKMTFAHQQKPDLTARKGQTSSVTVEWPVCSHLSVKNTEMQIQRPYTPTEVGNSHFELVVKRYQGGFMTPWLVSRKVGDKVEMRGPLVSFAYRPNMSKEIGMIAGGTGITPMYQLARHILSNPYDKSRISLIYGSRAENDILLRKELDTLQQQHPDRFSIYYLLDEAPRGWSGGQGLVDKRILEGRIPKAEDSNMVFVCGPDPMIDSVSGPLARDGSQGVLGGLLASMGYSEQQVWKFGAN